MERTKREDDTPARFAAWLRAQLEQRGYDLRPRGGGQTKFAEESGVGRATVSRILAGHGATDTRVLATLANALHLPLGEVLVQAGILDEAELSAVRDPTPGTRRITPEQAADELGIEDDQSRRLFVSMTHTLRRTPPPGDGAERADE
ncbi:helix-turn-helix domain-containing protein [Streptomyces iconiensis]|uniref:Helix-turn-helix transcriptional regulator n=1 Tax=Streptomyces iconiensis TaxID=1384038 RepID=A0ABT6ZRS8_9ACTN|nr:helix-turn-helix transcriptional regulator [Streptomyces iconiensis]MDJ1131755.1 helix-turn-helix transcriptional regulator [Streptomyces iconiensis]